MDNRAMYTLSYGLFVLSAQTDGFDNGCIINTACQVTSTPNRLTIAVNNANFTTEMVEKSGVFNLSVLDETAPFSIFETFGFRQQVGRRRICAERKRAALPARAHRRIPVLQGGEHNRPRHAQALPRTGDRRQDALVRAGNDLRLLSRSCQTQARSAEERLGLQDLRLRLRRRNAAGRLHLSAL